MSIPSHSHLSGRGSPSAAQRRSHRRLGGVTGGSCSCSTSGRSSSVVVQSFLSNNNPNSLSILPPTAVPPQELDILVPRGPRDPQEAELGWRNGLNKAYSIGAIIGAGAHGKVYLGRDRQSGQEVAIKMMAKVRGKQPRSNILRTISREATLMRAVQHCQGVASLIDTFEDANSAYLVLSLCRGGDLRRYVEVNGPLDETALVGVAREVLGVLQCCHQQGLLYADVKPANFCLPAPQGGPRNLKAIDFGCAQLLDASLRSTKRTGTMAFMAPETFDRNFGPKADVWSLGIMLYWLHSGRLPYWSNPDTPRAPSVDEMASVVHKSSIPFDYGPWLQISPEGRDFVARCLVRDEGGRLSVGEALEHPWVKKPAKGGLRWDVQSWAAQGGSYLGVQAPSQ